MEKDPQEYQQDSDGQVKHKRKRGRPPKTKHTQQGKNVIPDTKYAFDDHHQPISQPQLVQLRDSTKQVKQYSLQGLVKLAKVVDIYDGDSIKIVILMHDKLLKVALRLQGFDTAEIRSKIPQIKAFAQYTRDLVRKMLLDKIIKVRLGKSQKYGRTLARIMIKTISKQQICFNDWIIKQGLGLPYSGGHKTQYSVDIVQQFKNKGSDVKALQVIDYE